MSRDESRNNAMLHAKASGIVRDNVSGSAFIPATQRPDGSWRPAKKVKEGYVPPEDIGKFVCKAEREYRQRTQYVVGSSSLRREPSRGASESNFSAYDPKNDPMKAPELSKSAKKNAKRKAAKARKQNDINPEDAVIEDISSVIAGLNAAKIKSEDSGDSKKTVNASAPDSSLAELSVEEKQKQIKKRTKVLRQIEGLEKRRDAGETLDPDQINKIARKEAILAELAELGHHEEA
ncbi:Oidioi.mRNA.OKI2018_I69.PAR.g11650.t1.cds [Oikopleura dioica]|uniref:Oidioi.mRNA.OKI2018_I69.PAR.g11650.t1.cds n=1 Tax=Oikopleura dioica TaxID=34765 RepID=A0ABN7RWT5_OIKDI|nr:Oidioi.mRNA.OKI2018_I69.PAR.g11650.t1.cds [Oikopleura dioica]